MADISHKKAYNGGVMESQDRQASTYGRALEIIWLAAIFLLPLFFNPFGHVAYYLYKALLLQFLVVAMLGFWVADWLQSRTGTKGLRPGNIFNSPLHVAILAFGLLAIVATAASITPAISFWGSYFRKQGLLALLCWIVFFLIVAQNLRSRAQLFRALYALLVSSGIVSIIGIVQHFFPSLLPSFILPGRVFSTSGNPLSLSGFLAVVIPFNLALIVNSWNKRKEKRNTRILVGLVILLALQFCCLWLAQYSITILLYVIAPIIFLLLLGAIKRKKLLLSFGAIALIVLGIIAGLLIAPLLLPGDTTETPETEGLEQVSTAEDLGLNTLDLRAQYWQGAVDIILKSPEVPFSDDKLHGFRRLIGYGPETFIVTFQLFFPENMNRHHSLLAHPLDRPHNHYLYLATTIGLLGLMSFVAILAAFFYLSFRYLRKATSNADILLLTAMVAGMAQYMADIFFNIATTSHQVVFWFMLILVPVVGRLTFSNKDDGATLEPLTQPDNNNTPRITRTRDILSLGCALLLTIMGIVLVARPFAADMYLKKGLDLQTQHGEKAISAFDNAIRMAPGEAVYWHCLGIYCYDRVARRTSDESLRTKALTVAVSYYQKARELEPYIVYRYHLLADVYTYWAGKGTADKWPKALSLYDQASQLVPRNSIILNKWSLALIIKGDFSQARTKLDYAASIDPRWAETSFLTGLLLAKEGKSDEAVREISAPIQDDPTNLDYFINTCRRLATYSMVWPLADALETHTQGASDNWASHALCGITSLFSGSIDKGIGEFNSAMRLAPDSATADLFRAILRLSTMSPAFKTKLSSVATEWHAKLGQSPERDTLLPALDDLTRSAQ